MLLILIIGANRICKTVLKRSSMAYSVGLMVQEQLRIASVHMQHVVSILRQ